RGKKAIVQGFGNVGAAASYYLSHLGLKIVGIIDINGGLRNEEGRSFEEIQSLFSSEEGNTLSSTTLSPSKEINKLICKLPADIFLPCAASRLITKDQIDQLIDSGLQVVSCGANVPFADKEIFFGPIMEHTDQRISLIPDFISNCGDRKSVV